ncbi:32900_t:CDS:2, partial [Gigaspora margarita]
RIAREYIIKKVTRIVRLQDDEPTKVIYLNVKAFLAINELTNDLIELFEIGDVVYLKRKFIGNNNYYLVSATLIKMLNFDFNTMPALGINSVIVEVTTQTVKEIEDNLILEFHVEERIDNLDKSKRMTNDSGSEDLSIITLNCKFLNTQTLTIPWLSQMTIPGYSQRTNRQPREAIPQPSKNKNALLSNMNAMLVQQNLLVALGKNPIPNMTNEQPTQDQNSQNNTENAK